MKPLSLISVLFLAACASKPRYEKTVDRVDVDKFMGKWYVMAGRFTMFEKDVFNGIETYTLITEKNRIDVTFTYNQKSFDGKIKSLPQKGWIYNTATNSHWKVSPLWPLKFDYLIIDLASDYSWTVVGVPDQAYVWIMARDYNMPKSHVDEIIKTMAAKGYNMQDIVYVPHKY